MRRIGVLFALLLFGSASYLEAGQQVIPSGSVRTTLSLNGAWNVAGSNLQQTVTVPATIPFTAGITTWSRTFSLNVPRRPLVAFLEFEGIVHTAVVRLNGTEVGRLVAFTHSLLDVGSALNIDGVNTLEVEIDDRLTNATIPGGPTHFYVPLYGAIAYTFPVAWAHKPGIVRSVSLVYSDHAVITGIFAEQTFNAALSQLDLRVRVRVRGDVSANLATLIGVTRSGVITGTCLAQQAAPDELACTISVQAPSLWSPDNPVLHDLWITLFDVSGVVDAVLDRIGFRRIEARANQLFLNNRPLFLRGISRHDIYGANDFVADDATIEQDLLSMKNLGVNFVRAIHYPPDARLARRADELGMLLSEEIPAWAYFQDPAVGPIALVMVRSMIERDFNRASVIFWFTGSGDPAVASQYISDTIATARALDASRLVSFAIDDASYLPSQIQADAAMLRTGGAQLFVQNAYWPAAVLAQCMSGMPIDMPVLISEWSGSEGSNRGPIGDANVRAFPDNSYPWGGVYTEEFEAFTMVDRFIGWYPFTNCTAANGSACVVGLVYFTWQDISWPAMSYFYPGHYPMLRNGLVYEDRVMKTWPVGIFRYLMQLLPN